MLDKRNMLAHTYNEENFRQAIDLIANHYFEEIEKPYLLLESKK